MDRIDVVVDVMRPSSDKVIRGLRGTGSEEMAAQVRAARAFASWREGRDGGALRLEPAAQSAFESYADRLALGGRAIVRVGRVARTIADMEERELVSCDDVAEAIGFRSRMMG